VCTVMIITRKHAHAHAHPHIDMHTHIPKCTRTFAYKRTSKHTHVRVCAHANCRSATHTSQCLSYVCVTMQTDSNKDGIVDYGEFVSMWHSVASAAFKSYDRDGNGSLTPDEVRVVLFASTSLTSPSLNDMPVTLSQLACVLDRCAQCCVHLHLQVLTHSLTPLYSVFSFHPFTHT
jgi:hypothetical protein